MLEFSCFACPENEDFFSKLEISQGCEPYVTSMKLSNWLLLQVHNLSNQALIEGMKKVITLTQLFSNGVSEYLNFDVFTTHKVV